MRRLLAIILLTLLPLQFSWAAVASYCGHETRVGAGHFGHHEHQHHADTGIDAGSGADPDANLDATADVNGDKAPVAMDLDCGSCHGYCGVMLTLPSALPGTLAAAPPRAALDEADGAHAPTRPERPQWLPLA